MENVYQVTEWNDWKWYTNCHSCQLMAPVRQVTCSCFNTSYNVWWQCFFPVPSCLKYLFSYLRLTNMVCNLNYTASTGWMISERTANNFEVDFKLSPCCECCILSVGWLQMPGNHQKERIKNFEVVMAKSEVLS